MHGFTKVASALFSTCMIATMLILPASAAGNVIFPSTGGVGASTTLKTEEMNVVFPTVAGAGSTVSKIENSEINPLKTTEYERVDATSATVKSNEESKEKQMPETQPMETQPAETKAAETQPVETEPTETEPVETQSTETQPAQETEPQSETTEPTSIESEESAELEQKVEIKRGEPCVYDEVPLFFQTDYPDVPFGYGTISDSGCGISSLSMVASYILDETYHPDDIAEMVKDYDENYMKKMEYASDLLGLTYKKVYYWRDIYKELQNDKIAIVLVNGETGFTSDKHFMVLTGLTSDGRVLVNDPNGVNYNKSELAWGFKHGFNRATLKACVEGAWVYDRPADKLAKIVAEREAELSGEEIKAEKVQVNYDSVPLFFQDDYPDYEFGEGTIATSGCTVTSLAMVASYLTGYEMLPNEMADYTMKFGGSKLDRMEEASTNLGLQWAKTFNFNEVVAALQEGKIAIIMVGESSNFTGGQHCIVLTGITEDGKILVNDSNKQNYSKSSLQTGFESGFEQSQVQKGFSGAWIYETEVVGN